MNEPEEEIDRAEAVLATNIHHPEIECITTQRMALAVDVADLAIDSDGIECFTREDLLEVGARYEKLARDIFGVAHAMEIAECVPRQ